MTRRGTQVLAHPLFVAATLLLALNDHVFKGAGILPSGLTGKLSDVAGLFVLCALLAALPERRSRWVATGAACAVTALFAAVNLWVPANALVAPLWDITMDPTDLWCCPAAFAGAFWANRTASTRRVRPALRLALVGAAALACVATSPARYHRQYPTWRVAHHVAQDGTYVARTAAGDALVWVSRSGREGLGVTLQPSAAGITIARATVTTADGAVDGQIDAGGLYASFPFDNFDLWERRADRGTLVIVLGVDGDEQRVELPLVQEIEPR